MKILLAFGWIPVPVFYVNWSWLIGGFTPCVCIFMLERYRTDVGLHQHELLHAEQAYKMLLVFYALAYILSRRFRLDVEIAGYKRQMQYPSSNNGPAITIDQAAQYLSQDYHLDITVDDACKALA